MLELPVAQQHLFRQEFDAMVHPADLEGLQAASEPENAREGIYQSEFRLMLPSGTIRWMRSQWRFESAGGEPARATGAMIDITEEMNMLVRSQEAGAAAEAAARVARQAESLEQDRKTILELVAKDRPLDQIAATMALAVASHLPASLCSIRIELNEASRISVYPQFPEALARAIDTVGIDSIYGTLASAPIARLSRSRDCPVIPVGGSLSKPGVIPHSSITGPFRFFAPGS